MRLDFREVYFEGWPIIVSKRLTPIQLESNVMQLKPLYTVRFFYPDGWEVRLKDPSEQSSSVTEEEHFYFADGKCEGRIVGEFHGANHPHRRVDKSFVMNLQGFIKTEDGATIMTNYRGYGRSFQRSQQLYSAVSNEKTKTRRQVIGAAWHVTDNENYRWLNDSVCAIAGEVRVPPEIPPNKIKQADVKLVFSVAEIVWEPPPE